MSSIKNVVTRRRVLVGGSGIAGAKAIDNALLGYGPLTGTNLTQQDLARLASEGFGPTPFTLTHTDTTLRFDEANVHLVGREDEETLAISDGDIETARRMDRASPFDGTPVTELLTDLTSFADGHVRFEFCSVEDFFSRVGASDTRPYTALAFRKSTRRAPSPATIREFAETDPAATEELVTGLADGFQQHTRYNTERYVARSIQFNLLFDTVRLDGPFVQPTDFESMLTGAKTPLMCWDFTERSIEAFHAVSPHRQDVPVIGGRVDDTRHGHVYTALASVVRADSTLRIPITFLDYRSAILFDGAISSLPFEATVGAFGPRHRATRIRWDP